MINGRIVVAIRKCCLLISALIRVIKTIQKVLVTCLDDADLVCRGMQLRRLGAQLPLLFLSLRQNLLNISTLFAYIRITTLLH